MGSAKGIKQGFIPSPSKDSPWALQEPGRGSSQDGAKMDPSHEFSHFDHFGAISSLAFIVQLQLQLLQCHPPRFSPQFAAVCTFWGWSCSGVLGSGLEKDCFVCLSWEENL